MEPGRREEEEEEEEEEQGEEEKEDQPQLALIQNLKASLHYTVGSMCQEAADAKGVRFTKSTIAAISEVTFRQCEHFARDLELFARHAKRSTINMEDVKLLARRSSSLLNCITKKSEEISRVNQEQKDKKKKKAEGGSKKSSKQAVTKMDIDD